MAMPRFADGFTLALGGGGARGWAHVGVARALDGRGLRPRLLTSGRLVDALEVSIAVPLFFPPHRDSDGVWCDAGPWEGIPVSLAREWDPALPVVGVLADIP